MYISVLLCACLTFAGHGQHLRSSPIEERTTSVAGEPGLAAETREQGRWNCLKAAARLLLAFTPAEALFNPSILRIPFPMKRFSPASSHLVSMAEKRSKVLQRMGNFFQGALLLQDAFEEHVTGQVIQESWTEARFCEIAKSVHAAPSSRHGLGLFASSDLEEDMLVTFYPVHRVQLKGETIDMEDDRSYWDNSTSLYEVQISKDLSIDCNPHREDVVGWLAHRANDAAMCNGTTEKQIMDYQEICDRDCNVAWVNFGNVLPIMALITTRPVHKGEELFLRYSDEYWNGKEGVKSKLLDLLSEGQRLEHQERDERISYLYEHEIDCFKDLLREAGLSADGSVTHVGSEDVYWGFGAVTDDSGSNVKKIRKPKKNKKRVRR